MWDEHGGELDCCAEIDLDFVIAIHQVCFPFCEVDLPLDPGVVDQDVQVGIF